MSALESTRFRTSEVGYFEAGVSNGRKISIHFWMLLIGLGASSLGAQRVSLEDRHTRFVIVTAGRDGVGSRTEPFRPRGLSNPELKLLGFTSARSADGTKHFIELVSSATPAQVSRLLAADPAVEWFRDKAVTPRAEIERKLKSLQPAASLERLTVRRP